ncbi:MAG: SAM-dependent methyltransferase [Clostridiales bacterium]|nr:MAG: SAM-dependent methyltransferase [Clostridiales bacterium]
MWVADKWTDFEVIDCSSGEKLERWGQYTLIRPDPQVIWHTQKSENLWQKPSARYDRSKTGGGAWQINNLPAIFQVSYKNLRFALKPMGFKHTGLFPEQAVNWDFMQKAIKNAGREITVLNLFAYTGAASLACSAAGAKVCHVDASKGMVSWAKENAVLNGISDIRFIVDDCLKFVEREIRRGKKYDAIIMDPPSYGRGPNGEVWKLEDELHNLLNTCLSVLSDKPLFFILNSYTTGLGAACMKYMLEATVQKKFGGRVEADEIGLPVKVSSGVLPCGTTARWIG